MNYMYITTMNVACVNVLFRFSNGKEGKRKRKKLRVGLLSATYSTLYRFDCACRGLKSTQGLFRWLFGLVVFLLCEEATMVLVSTPLLLFLSFSFLFFLCAFLWLARVRYRWQMAGGCLIYFGIATLPCPGPILALKDWRVYRTYGGLEEELWRKGKRSPPSPSPGLLRASVFIHLALHCPIPYLATYSSLQSLKSLARIGSSPSSHQIDHLVRF